MPLNITEPQTTESPHTTELPQITEKSRTMTTLWVTGSTTAVGERAGRLTKSVFVKAA